MRRDETTDRYSDRSPKHSTRQHSEPPAAAGQVDRIVRRFIIALKTHGTSVMGATDLESST